MSALGYVWTNTGDTAKALAQASALWALKHILYDKGIPLRFGLQEYLGRVELFAVRCACCHVVTRLAPNLVEAWKNRFSKAMRSSRRRTDESLERHIRQSTQLAYRMFCKTGFECALWLRAIYDAAGKRRGLEDNFLNSLRTMPVVFNNMP